MGRPGDGTSGEGNQPPCSQTFVVSSVHPLMPPIVRGSADEPVEMTPWVGTMRGRLRLEARGAGRLTSHGGLACGIGWADSLVGHLW